MSQHSEKEELNVKDTDNANVQEATLNNPNAANESEIEVDLEDKWMIRDCGVYEDEYDECTSFKARFHQYFIYGETIDCNQWKRDYDNCCKWTDDNDRRAGEAVIKSEQERRMERFRAHYRNDVWKKRDAPPDDWNAPLPEWMVKRDENTYLAKKAQEIRDGEETEDSQSSCCIM